MSKLLGGLLTVAGSSIAGGAGGKLEELKERAQTARDENIARLNTQYRKEEITLRDELAGGREASRRVWESGEKEAGFQRGILQRETEAGIALKKQSQVFDQQLEKTLAVAKLSTEIKNAAKSQTLKTRDDLIAMGLSDDKANETAISMLTTAKETGMDRAVKYSKVRKNALDGLAQGLDVTPEMEVKATELADGLMKRFYRPGEKDDDGKVSPKVGDTRMGIEGSKYAGKQLTFGPDGKWHLPEEKKDETSDVIMMDDLKGPEKEPENVEVLGTTGHGFKFGIAPKFGTVIFEGGKWRRPSKLEFKMIKEAMNAGE